MLSQRLGHSSRLVILSKSLGIVRLVAPPALGRVLEVRSRAMRVNLHISEPISASHSSLRSDNFGGLPLGQSHSGCSGVNKRNIDFVFHSKAYNLRTFSIQNFILRVFFYWVKIKESKECSHDHTRVENQM